MKYTILTIAITVSVAYGKEMFPCDLSKVDVWADKRFVQGGPTDGNLNPCPRCQEALGLQDRGVRGADLIGSVMGRLGFERFPMDKDTFIMTGVDGLKDYGTAVSSDRTGDEFFKMILNGRYDVHYKPHSDALFLGGWRDQGPCLQTATGSGNMNPPITSANLTRLGDGEYALICGGKTSAGVWLIDGVSVSIPKEECYTVRPGENFYPGPIDQGQTFCGFIRTVPRVGEKRVTLVLESSSHSEYHRHPSTLQKVFSPFRGVLGRPCKEAPGCVELHSTGTALHVESNPFDADLLLEMLVVHEEQCSYGELSWYPLNPTEFAGMVSDKIEERVKSLNGELERVRSKAYSYEGKFEEIKAGLEYAIKVKFMELGLTKNSTTPSTLAPPIWKPTETEAVVIGSVVFAVVVLIVVGAFVGSRMMRSKGYRKMPKY